MCGSNLQDGGAERAERTRLRSRRCWRRQREANSAHCSSLGERDDGDDGQRDDFDCGFLTRVMACLQLCEWIEAAARGTSAALGGKA